MKVKITKPDGSAATLKGKPAEVVEVLQALGYQASPWAITQRSGAAPSEWAAASRRCRSSIALTTVGV